MEEPGLMEEFEEPPVELRVEEQPEVRAQEPARPAQIVWEADGDIDPFAAAVRTAPRRQGSGYWGH
jgi:hypothetical protein